VQQRRRSISRGLVSIRSDTIGSPGLAKMFLPKSFRLGTRCPPSGIHQQRHKRSLVVVLVLVAAGKGLVPNDIRRYVANHCRQRRWPGHRQSNNNNNKQHELDRGLGTSRPKPTLTNPRITSLSQQETGPGLSLHPFSSTRRHNHELHRPKRWLGRLQISQKVLPRFVAIEKQQSPTPERVQ